MRSDSPSPSWYEPLDLVDDDHEPAPITDEVLTTTPAYGWWSAATVDAEDMP